MQYNSLNDESVKFKKLSKMDVNSLYCKIKNDPERIEWDQLVYHFPNKSKRWLTLTKFVAFFTLLSSGFTMIYYGGDLSKTFSETMTWVLMFIGAIVSLFIGSMSIYHHNRQHCILSQYGLITKEHVYSPDLANKVGKKILAALAILTVLTIFIVGPTALIGAGGLGVTWLVLSLVDFEKFGLTQRISSIEDILFVRVHDDSDEPRDNFRLYHSFYSFHEHDHGEIETDEQICFYTDIFCQAGTRDEVIDKIETFHGHEISKDTKNLFDSKNYDEPQEISELMRKLNGVI
ncbi:hypothetical protein [Photobacterium galatheae]|uniref:Uncharacterized protein n=1 Tax=Photobacterium galatheae TaxID=1654360 RepID=A0A066RS75_9GAMM|nr:hypothetical protein [Photobacterium galatheae]KDM93295.1 hypothetical protein EA58_01410 [Photobacterium galatheae]MCM0150420.1 hypothetical protein [Photobacterium galatheae]